jgi:transposase-like protein
MTMEFTKVEVEETFKVCPNCGYEDGFHSMFQKIGDNHDFSWRFICPNCHKTFDIGLKVKMAA